jgi:hypothetical protein
MAFRMRTSEAMIDRIWKQYKYDFSRQRIDVTLVTVNYFPGFGRSISWNTYLAHSLPWNRPPKRKKKP